MCVLRSQDGKNGTAPLAAFDRADDEDLIYADSDYKDVYDYGPVSYREASKVAAAKKKENLDKRFKAALQSHQQPPPINHNNKGNLRELQQVFLIVFGPNLI